MPSSECPNDFYLYSPRPHLQYGGPHHNRSSGTTPCFTVAPSRTAYAETLQLSNPVVELKYVNRRQAIRVATSTKAVSGENPVVNQVRKSKLAHSAEALATPGLRKSSGAQNSQSKALSSFFVVDVPSILLRSFSTCISPRQ